MAAAEAILTPLASLVAAARAVKSLRVRALTYRCFLFCFTALPSGAAAMVGTLEELNDNDGGGGGRVGVGS